ncbi:hypothetical protein ELQ90_12235 [Labedella phragmitis]|uniref:Uncharacterized protein n=1 Tax=Labedella phragmitis TaxID=2498849 RepID=A0A3S3Z189_9MICO|nr:hypothetical protein [Labedella phragmitis]RWZ49533.1 hypothetical protein ELQ90_12235 [Labedella phragmitis]
MRHISALIAIAILALGLTGCSDPDPISAGDADASSSPSPTSQTDGSAGEFAISGSADPEAQAQARTWLESVELPAGATHADARVARFDSFTGWPCGPVAELETFWSIPNSTMGETANWLMDNPPAELLSTAVGPLPNDASLKSAIVGFVPEEGAQEGIVFTLQKTQDGVAVRAEVAAQTDDATCPDLPDGEGYGAPGQG